MSGSHKHPSYSPHHVEYASVSSTSTTSTPAPLMVSAMRWSGSGVGNQTTSHGPLPSTFTIATTANVGNATVSSTHRGVQARSRNIDIPNSKARLRSKHFTPASTRHASTTRKLNGMVPLQPPASNTALNSSNLSWHSRPPRGGLSYATASSSHNHSQDDSTLKRGKKSTSTHRRVESRFSLAATNSSETVVWEDDLDREDESNKETPMVDLKQCEVKAHDPPSPLFRPSASSMRNKDAVEDLARALLSDCINKRNMELQKIKKIKLDIMPGTSPTAGGSVESFPSPKDLDMKGMSTYEDVGSGLSCSSSDDELNNLHNLEPSFAWDESHAKLSHDICRESEIMVLTSSPGSDGFYEEKGLPKEVRYSLPIAYGTVSETEKHCTICQVAYEIGSHIVTLTPCQHFFHALCVDKWLWNHVTCPLCRKEVVYEFNELQQAPVHVRGTECPEEDQENMRKKLRSQCAEFRPVKPLTVNCDMDQLDAQFSNMQIQDERKHMQLEHLVCPTPQRKFRK
ncbi:hypothetical protein Ae201684_007015 [Aphanomyces euteiches]|uniref:RING-type domain-containing protein n=1 Tax=Aphanomyces euteiches TaxID=100861 RepID=A0A6G0X9T2_9STRA|nr:hypothetical protein Ae201684_007015 [Aphanomyces euteiches]